VVCARASEDESGGDSYGNKPDSYSSKKPYYAGQKKATGMLIKDTPKSLTCGTMTTHSATLDKKDLRNVKIGQQWAYQVGKISGSM
jgi:hypothetical protein